MDNNIYNNININKTNNQDNYNVQYNNNNF